MQRWLDECLDRGNPAAVDGLVAPDCRGHVPGGARAFCGRESLKELVAWYERTFRERHSTLKDALMIGTTVVAWVETSRLYREAPDRQQPTVDTSIQLYRIEGGKIRDVWF